MIAEILRKLNILSRDIQQVKTAQRASAKRERKLLTAKRGRPRKVK